VPSVDTEADTPAGHRIDVTRKVGDVTCPKCRKEVSR
jgi:hypothetical protein